MAVGPLHTKLVPNQITELTLDLPDPEADNLSFRPGVARVEVLNVDGVEAVYFTTNGDPPAIAQDGCHVLPKAVGAVEVDDETPGPTSLVKLISAGAPQISIRAV